MNTRKNLLTLAGLALVAVGGWATVTACSSDNVTPGGGDASMETGSSSGGGSGSGSGSGSGGSSGSSGAGDDGGGSSGAGEGGSSGGEAGNCMSDATTCSSCTTPATDPYNACSSFVTNCVPFDDTKVPTHPTL
jgi:hypothetical protein